MKIRIVWKGFLLSLLWLLGCAPAAGALAVFIRALICACSHTGQPYILVERWAALGVFLLYAVFYVLEFRDHLRYSPSCFSEAFDPLVFSGASWMAVWQVIVLSKGRQPGIVSYLLCAVLCVCFAVSFSCFFFKKTRHWKRKTKCAYIQSGRMQTDQLFRIVMRERDIETALQAVKALRAEQNLIAQIALDQRLAWEIRAGAIRELDAQHPALGTALLTDPHDRVRFEAAARCQDQACLAQGLQDADMFVRWTCAERVESPAAREQAASDKYGCVRAAVVRRLDDRQLLMRLLRDPVESVYTGAIERLQEIGMEDRAALQTYINELADALESHFTADEFQRLVHIYQGFGADKDLQFRSIGVREFGFSEHEDHLDESPYTDHYDYVPDTYDPYELLDDPAEN